MSLRPWLLLAAALAAAGCGTRCTPSTDVPHCDGNTLISCPTPGVDQFTPTVLQHEDCKDHVCVVAGGRGLCALSATPAPACDGGSVEVCESATSRFRCAAGVALDRDPCRSGAVEPDAGVQCVGGPATACTQSADCAPGLTCQNQFCFAP
jgi:hypothetical protein